MVSEAKTLNFRSPMSPDDLEQKGIKPQYTIFFFFVCVAFTFFFKIKINISKKSKCIEAVKYFFFSTQISISLLFQ